MIDDLVAVEAALLRDLDLPSGPWRYRHSVGRTTSHAAFLSAVTMPGAPEAMALLRTYADAVHLAGAATWSMSAMPSYSGPTDVCRFSTISTGGVELFFVWVDAIKGVVSHWGLRLDHRVSVPPVFEIEMRGNDMFVLGDDLTQLQALLSDPNLERAVKVTREHRQWPRRSAWHNPWLAALICPGQSATDAASDALFLEPDEPEFRS